jgi:hypothetical protein
MQGKPMQNHMADHSRDFRQHLIQSTVDLMARPELTAGDVRQALDASGLRLRSTGYGNFTLEIKRQRALCFLDTLPEREYVPEVATVLGGGK